MLALALATLATNIAANVVSPANDFAHLWPQRISFRIGGFITGDHRHPDSAVAACGQCRRLYRQMAGRLLALLGAVGGVLIADYFVIRRTRLDQAGLYQRRVRTGTPAASICWRSSHC